MADDVKEPDRPAITMLQVVNNNDFPMNDMFDGVPIEFPTGVAVDITADKASHFFGWPGEDHHRAVHMASRYGWATRDQLAWNKDRKPLYWDKAMNVVITPIYYDLVRRSPNAPIPADDGGPDDSRPVAVMEADTSAKVGRRNKRATTGKRLREGDRHRMGKVSARSR